MLVPVTKDGKYQLISLKTEQPVTDVTYDKILEEWDGLFAASLKGKLVYLDKKGVSKLETDFDFSDDYDIYENYKFVEGLALIKLGGKFNVIDKKGKVVLELPYHRVWDRKGGVFVVRHDEEKDEFGVVDRKGKVIVPLGKYEYIGGFSEGLAPVRGVKDGMSLYGYIDVNGKEVIPLQFFDADDFQNGMAAVQTGQMDFSSAYPTDLFGFIDKTGKFKIKPKFGWTWSFSGKYGTFKEGPDRENMGAFTRRGKIVVPGQYYSVSDVSDEGVLGAQEVYEGGYAMINVEGKVLLPFEYGYIRPAGEGLMLVPKDEKISYYDMKGKLVFKTDYSSACPFVDGFARVKKGDKWGMINTKGEEVLPTEYDYIYWRTRVY